MEIINTLIETTLNSFDFTYCICVNIATYVVINIILGITKKKNLSVWLKRLILVLCTIVLGSIYVFTGSEFKYILNSSILAPVFWSWVMKPICNKFGIDYKQLSVFE